MQKSPVALSQKRGTEAKSKGGTRLMKVKGENETKGVCDLIVM